MADERHINALQKILNDRIGERQAIAASYPEAEDAPAVAAKVASTQLEIEALQRAIEHEKQALRGAGYDWSAFVR